MDHISTYTTLPHEELVTTNLKEENIITSEVLVDRKPKILILTPDLRNICGVSNYFNTIRLDEDVQGLDYLFVNTIEKENSFTKLKRLFINYITFIKKLNTGNYKLIHINPSLNANSFFRDSIFCLIAYLYKVKFVVFFRGWEDKFESKLRKNFFLKSLFNCSYRQCLNFIVLGNSFKEKLLSLGVNEQKTKFWIESTVANSSYLSGFSLEKKFISFKDEINILFISRIVKLKGTYTAIDAFKILLQQNPNFKLNLFIAGDGTELPSVKNYVTQHHIKSVHFLGFVKNDQKRDVLLNSHILLFPTQYGEGLPNCILEGMLYGMPIISRYNGAISDVVTHEENGFLTESTDPKVFSDFMNQIINDNNLYRKIAKSNHEKALDSFTKDKVKGRILEIYRQLM